MIVDIHNHILPAMDDGARDMTETLLMAKQAAESGITHVIATPHHKNKKYVNEPEKIFQQIAVVNSMLSRDNIQLEILPGMEVHLYEDLAKDLKALEPEVLTLNSSKKYVLVELPYTYIPHFTGTIFYEMQLMNLIPVIAHPERNEEIQRKPNLLVDLIRKGALTQITAASLLGIFGRNQQKFSLKLLEHNLVHFIASDAHNTTKRSCQLLSAYKYIKKQYSNTHAEYFIENAVHVVKGSEFPRLPPTYFKRRKKYSIFHFDRKLQ